MGSKAWEQMNAEIVQAGGPEPYTSVPNILGELDPVTQFVNCGISAKPWVHILIKYAPELTHNERDMVVRSMMVKGLKEAVPYYYHYMRTQRNASMTYGR